MEEIHNLSRLTDDQPFFLWNFGKCRDFQDVITLNELSLVEVADYTDHSLKSILSLEPAGYELITTIEDCRTLVWPQKSFFINQVIIPFLGEGKDFKEPLQNIRLYDRLNPRKNEEILKFLNRKTLGRS